jgi:hypothetical protein
MSDEAAVEVEKAYNLLAFHHAECLAYNKDLEQRLATMREREGFLTWIMETYPTFLEQYKALQDLERASNEHHNARL